jgi:hypothetical protein
VPGERGGRELVAVTLGVGGSDGEPELDAVMEPDGVVDAVSELDGVVDAVGEVDGVGGGVGRHGSATRYCAAPGTPDCPWLLEPQHVTPPSSVSEQE